jgi:hypothetical protein
METLPSCLYGKFSEWLESEGEWRNPACHVRRAGKSGLAYKEDMAEIPLTHGEITCLLKYTRGQGRQSIELVSVNRRIIWLSNSLVEDSIAREGHL